MDVKEILEKEFERLHKINDVLLVNSEECAISPNLYEEGRKNISVMCEIARILDTNESK